MNNLPITSFNAKYAFLSNFFPATVTYEGVQYPTTEHAYQATKIVDPMTKLQIQHCQSPSFAKALARKSRAREEWHLVKLQVMEELLRQKFTRHERLKRMLLDTGESLLVEGNNWGDVFWGVSRGRGDNHLGRLLMKIREELREHVASN